MELLASGQVLSAAEARAVGPDPSEPYEIPYCVVSGISGQNYLTVTFEARFTEATADSYALVNLWQSHGLQTTRYLDPDAMIEDQWYLFHIAAPVLPEEFERVFALTFAMDTRDLHEAGGCHPGGTLRLEVRHVTYRVTEHDLTNLWCEQKGDCPHHGVSTGNPMAFMLQNCLELGCPEDVNGDCSIDMDDVNIVNRALAFAGFATCSTMAPAGPSFALDHADVNDDGSVTFDDLLDVLAATGFCDTCQVLPIDCSDP